MQSIRVFISSVQSEFAKDRKLLCDYIRQDALLGKFFVPFLFEELPAMNSSAPQTYLTEVSASDIYIGLLGKIYGKENKEGVSPVEQEYNVATKHNKQRLIFIKKMNKYSIHSKQVLLIAKMESDVVRKSFIDYEELKSAVYASLIRYLEEKEFLRLLPFDATLHHRATIDDIDGDRVELFVKIAQGKRGFPIPSSAGIEAILTHLSLMTADGRITNAGLLLFAKKPQSFFITSEIKCVQFYGTDIVKPIPAYQVYRGDVFQIIDQAVDFVMSRIDARVGTRKERTDVDIDYELPLEAVREAIVNAVTHRDYTSNASVQVMLFKDRLEIWNPGRLPYGLTVNNLRKAHPSVPANPILANPIYLAGYIERMGTGTRDIISKCAEIGLNAPYFLQEENFKVIIWRKQSGILNDTINDTINDKDIYSFIKENPLIKLADIVDYTGKSRATVIRRINILKEHNLIEYAGSLKTGGYKVK